MSEFLKISLTASATLIGGIFLFILTNIFVIPIQEVRKLIGEIGYHLFLYRNLITNLDTDGDIHKEKLVELNEATSKFKELSARLRTFGNVIPLYGFFSLIRILPNKKDLFDAAGSLSTISNAKNNHNKPKLSREIDNCLQKLKLYMYGDR
jgi:hypothetical protein